MLGLPAPGATGSGRAARSSNGLILVLVNCPPAAIGCHRGNPRARPHATLILDGRDALLQFADETLSPGVFAIRMRPIALRGRQQGPPGAPPNWKNAAFVDQHGADTLLKKNNPNPFAINRLCRA
jgi:hypothetical protein